jgi:hypothetical protein
LRRWIGLAQVWFGHLLDWSPAEEIAAGSLAYLLVAAVVWTLHRAGR